MSGATLLFLAMAIVIIGTAVGMLVSRNTVYSALFLILNFSAVGILYLQLGAPFIALAQISIYAGAIMILFLFVIMLLGVEQLSSKEALHWQRPLAILSGVVLMGVAGYVLILKGGSQPPLAAPEASFASPTAIGNSLFTHYLLPFEATSFILLVAVIGAIVLTKTEKNKNEQNRSQVTPISETTGREEKKA